MRRLIDVKREIVHTIRQAVDVVSKYAGGALPEPARTRVRGFILTLPQRWASKAGGTGAGAISTAGNSERDSTVTAAASGSGATRRPGGQRRAAYRERGSGGIEGDLRSGASSRATSPSMSPRIPRTAVSRRGGGGGDVGDGGENARVPAGTALVAAQRILALATESLDMMRNVTGVMKDSLDRAEAFVFFFLQHLFFHLLIILYPDGLAVYGQLVFNATHNRKKPLLRPNLNFYNVLINIIIIAIAAVVHQPNSTKLIKIIICLVHLSFRHLLQFGVLIVYLLLQQGVLSRPFMLVVVVRLVLL